MTSNTIGVKPKLFEICRLCLSEDDVKWSLFDGDGLKRNFQNKIFACLCLAISQFDSLPGNICDKCAWKLEEFYDFKQTCEKSDEYLRNNGQLYATELFYNDKLKPKVELDQVMAHDMSLNKADNKSTNLINGSYLDVCRFSNFKSDIKHSNANYFNLLTTVNNLSSTKSEKTQIDEMVRHYPNKMQPSSVNLCNRSEKELVATDSILNLKHEVKSASPLCEGKDLDKIKPNKGYTSEIVKIEESLELPCHPIRNASENSSQDMKNSNSEALNLEVHAKKRRFLVEPKFRPDSEDELDDSKKRRVISPKNDNSDNENEKNHLNENFPDEEAGNRVTSVLRRTLLNTTPVSESSRLPLTAVNGIVPVVKKSSSGRRKQTCPVKTTDIQPRKLDNSFVFNDDKNSNEGHSTTAGSIDSVGDETDSLVDPAIVAANICEVTTADFSESVNLSNSHFDNSGDRNPAMAVKEERLICVTSDEETNQLVIDVSYAPSSSGSSASPFSDGEVFFREEDFYRSRYTYFDEGFKLFLDQVLRRTHKIRIPKTKRPNSSAGVTGERNDAPQSSMHQLLIAAQLAAGSEVFDSNSWRNENHQSHAWNGLDYSAGPSQMARPASKLIASGTSRSRKRKTSSPKVNPVVGNSSDPSTVASNPDTESEPQPSTSSGRRGDLECTNCRTKCTTIWRRSPGGQMVCNACGLYFKLHRVNRPVSMRRDTIHTRRRRPRAEVQPVTAAIQNVEQSAPAEPMQSSSDYAMLSSTFRRQLAPHLLRDSPILSTPAVKHTVSILKPRGP